MEQLKPPLGAIMWFLHIEMLSHLAILLCAVVAGINGMRFFEWEGNFYFCFCGKEKGKEWEEKRGKWERQNENCWFGIETGRNL